MLDKSLIISVSEKAAGPFYIYDLAEIEQRLNLVRKNLPRFNILYSMKANPHEAILRELLNLNAGIDAASVNEVHSARKAGFKKDAVFYSAPGKKENEIRSALGECVLIADSVNELKKLNLIAKGRGEKLQAGVRLNIKNDGILKSEKEIMSGKSSKFGISYDEFYYLDASFLSNLEIICMHVYFGSQLLDENIIYNNFRIIAAAAAEIKKKHSLKYVNFGGGFGIPYNKGEKELDLEKIASLIHNDSTILSLFNSDTVCNLELGRFLAATSCLYATRVVDIKTSFGKTYVLVDGGMNSFYRPILTKDFHDIIQFRDSGEKVSVVLAGTLCTPVDEYYNGISISLPEIGDLIAFKNAGAYGYSLSLLEFISYDKPKQIFVKGDNIEYFE